MSNESLKDTTVTPVVGGAPAVKPPNKVAVKWDGEHRFDGRRQSGGPSIHIDASGKTGPGPVDTLLIALASCTGVDVVDILAKRRTPVESFDIEVVGDRHNGIPARLTKIHLVYTIAGAGIQREHAERAIELAVTKYCSVRDSLDANMPVTWELVLS
ncbi:MAG: OsmC family protein [Gemmatimonadaceae bacterium]|nr:OsmC family protein [Gemmatimonadaceae bacterium]